MVSITEKHKTIKIKKPKLDIKHGHINLSHGSGGRAMQDLIEQLFIREFANDLLSQQNDAACFAVQDGRMVMTTDAHVIAPLFFPGGDIGCLSVHGTINDLAMMGATPLYLTASFILEEGLALTDLHTIICSMAAAAKSAGVPIIAGDTKVVERGKGDGVFITTTGIGRLANKISISGHNAKPGDKVLISGYVGDHGVAVMSKRENLQFITDIESDTKALQDLVASMIAAVPNIHCLRDPTRGGVATSLNEIAQQSRVGFMIQESQIPIREPVQSACELLGLDPLYVANEGLLIAICADEDADLLLTTMRQHPYGKDAMIIGTVIADDRHMVQLETSFGGSRIMDMLTGEQLPRIC